ncbi:WxL domain-containing protein [Enterococcus pallens]|uniref:WxL domain cell surface protein n=1 Tax=Enterococcus pallens ATCC BAA-351 TaxID=1158607 RepID=R2QLT0_9ENTE|nr:WxL domain-containing protein [Enterococcus pallens]EOH97512.1 WxL domain cell surface protein [Enterococcus pallens ATCC BAA-351]EOU21069.1 WxL domain cell surface protein [Enterococcus pallens ATCC BAA-351]OJG77796.1 WxL domain cell surface protein [Enterococcus pallens]
MKNIKLLSIVALSAIALTTVSTTAFAADSSEYHSHGVVEFVPNDGQTDPVDPENPDPENPVNPVDPTNPDQKPEPGTNGPLSIDYASSFDFGLNKISNKDQTYYARAQHYGNGHADTENYVQVSDNRGTNAGWTLTVKQDGQLTATTTTLNKVLDGSQITVKKPTVTSNAKGVTPPEAKEITLNPDGSESLVMSAKADSGAGTWEDYWGKVESVKEKDKDGKEQDVNVTKDVSLSVPGATPKDAVKYQTTLTWMLTDVPGN